MYQFPTHRCIWYKKLLFLKWKDLGWTKWVKMVNRYKLPVLGDGAVMYSGVNTVNNTVWYI